MSKSDEQEQSKPVEKNLVDSKPIEVGGASEKASAATLVGLVAGALVLGGLVFVGMRHSDKKAIDETAHWQHNDTISRDVNALNKKIQQLEPIINSHKERRHDKSMLRRQHAPSSMYSTTISKHGERVTFDTLGDGSNDARFVNKARVAKSIKAMRLAHPDYTLVSGELIHAVLESSIQSDLPGMVRAIVTQDAWGYTANKRLIPIGSRLIGQYSSQVIQGQQRLTVVWSRVILPNGIIAEINSPGTGPMGRAGVQADNVDTHFVARFSEATLFSLLGAASSITGASTSDRANSIATYRAGISENFQQAASESIKAHMNRRPTLTVNQGAKINVFVGRDVSFYDVLHQS